MGQKVFRNGSLIISTGYYYPTRPVDEEDLLLLSFHDHAGTGRCVDDSCTAAMLCAVSQAVCEFQDYCNHLYYIDGRCDCPSAWKRTAGLVLPVSA